MSEIILYSTGCKNCIFLERKLKAKHIPYKKETDLEVIKELGFRSVPLLSIDGEIKQFFAAIDWLIEQEVMDELSD